MGIDVSQTGDEFYIAAEHKAAAYMALRSRMEAMRCPHHLPAGSGPCSRCERPLERLASVTTLEGALRAFEWKPTVDAEGNIISIDLQNESVFRYTNREEVFADLFETIAPYVAPGSWIEMLAEDDMEWRWTFDGSSVTFEETVKPCPACRKNPDECGHEPVGSGRSDGVGGVDSYGFHDDIATSMKDPLDPDFEPGSIQEELSSEFGRAWRLYVRYRNDFLNEDVSYDSFYADVAELIGEQFRFEEWGYGSWAAWSLQPDGIQSKLDSLLWELEHGVRVLSLQPPDGEDSEDWASKDVRMMQHSPAERAAFYRALAIGARALGEPDFSVFWLEVSRNIARFSSEATDGAGDTSTM